MVRARHSTPHETLWVAANNDAKTAKTLHHTESCTLFMLYRKRAPALKETVAQAFCCSSQQRIAEHTPLVAPTLT
jgi:hypothetical protein